MSERDTGQSDGAAFRSDGTAPKDKTRADVETFPIVDRDGQSYEVTYIKATDSKNVLDTMAVQQYRADLVALTHKGFDDITEENIESKFTGSDALHIVTNADNKIVSFQAYKRRVLPAEKNDGQELKIMLTSFAVTAEEFKNKDLIKNAWEEVVKKEKPDILAGSTNVEYMYRANQSMAEQTGMRMYPAPFEPVPPQIAAFGRKVLLATLGDPTKPIAPPDDNLIRTRDINGQLPDVSFFNDRGIDLDPAKNQQVFYMLLAPKVNDRILAPKQ